MLNKKIFLSIVFIASMAGCDGKKDEKPLTENVSETSINSSAKKSITLIDGKFAIDIPEGMEEAVNQEGIIIDKIYNPSVGKYDVRVITGPGFQTKRQESLEAMAQLLQGNPQLWSVAGDLFIKNMDWPGAQDMAKRFAKVIDPKILGNDEDNPALAAAKQQIEAMNAEMQQMAGMLQNVQQSFEARDIEIKEFKADIEAYNAETKRIAAVQAGMSEQQIPTRAKIVIIGGGVGGTRGPAERGQRGPALRQLPGGGAALGGPPL